MPIKIEKTIHLKKYKAKRPNLGLFVERFKYANDVLIFEVSTF